MINLKQLLVRVALLLILVVRVVMVVVVELVLIVMIVDLEGVEQHFSMPIQMLHQMPQCSLKV